MIQKISLVTAVIVLMGCDYDPLAHLRGGVSCQELLTSIECEADACKAWRNEKRPDGNWHSVCIERGRVCTMGDEHTFTYDRSRECLFNVNAHLRGGFQE